MDPNELFEIEVKRWFADEGDATHRQNYPLTQDSIVLDIGGYEGRFAKEMHEKFGCFVDVFEPVESFYQNIIKDLSYTPEIRVFKQGVSDKSGYEVIMISGDGTSMYRTDGTPHMIYNVEINELLSGYDKIDLMKINAEGSEYHILEAISHDNLLKINNIQVQFHTFIPDCANRRAAIQSRLSQTHEITYNYEFVWENWKIKS